MDVREVLQKKLGKSMVFCQTGGGGHSASEEAQFCHFQSVSETVSFVFSVNLIHILNLFWPIWIPLGKYGQFMAIVIFW